jgi:processive 1,2-diacylglycerol beta-glucosyltransferase
MLKNVLIISSEHTGHGHKSITESLCESFALHEDIKVTIIDGFSLGGNVLLKIGKMYGPITRNAKFLWKMIWELSLSEPGMINRFIESLIRDDLLRLIDIEKPDLIITVHPNFNGSILNIFDKENIKIPLVTFIADLVSISPLWADPRADYIICPTEEAKQKCLGFHIPESKLKVIGFPVRSRFYGQAAERHSIDVQRESDRPFRCLLMSGGEGAGNMVKVAEELLKNFNCSVSIVAGRNEKVKSKLEKALTEKYGSRVEVYGFVNNIQELMRSSDLAITRGSPNVMMEAVSCNIPIVITDALPGQEERNPEFAQKYNLGVACKNIRHVRSAVNELLSNDAIKINQIRNAQRSYRNPKNSAEIVNFVADMPFGSGPEAAGSEKNVYH